MCLNTTLANIASCEVVPVAYLLEKKQTPYPLNNRLIEYPDGKLEIIPLTPAQIAGEMIVRPLIERSIQVGREVANLANWLKNLRGNFTCRRDPFKDGQVETYLQTGTFRFELFAEEVDEKEDHPAYKAMKLHQKRHEILKRGLQGATHYRYEELRDLLYEEAVACYDAAKLADGAEKKLEWIARGLVELNLSTNPQKKQACPFEGIKKCEVGAQLWEMAGDIFLKAPYITRCYHQILDYKHSHFPFTDSRFLASQCFYNAAYCTRRECCDISELYKRSIEALTAIDVTAYPLAVHVEVQEEIFFRTKAALNHSMNVAIDEALYSVNFTVSLNNNERRRTALKTAFLEVSKTLELYQKLIQESTGGYRTHCMIKRVYRLIDAGYLSTDTKQKLSFYTQARDCLKEAWEQDSTSCLDDPEFTCQKSGDFSLENSLLGLVEKLVKENPS